VTGEEEAKMKNRENDKNSNPPLPPLIRFAGRPGKERTGHGCAPCRDAPPVIPLLQRGKEGDFPRPETRYPIPDTLEKGFTLLEVMIAMANESRAMTTLALLAQSRMAEVEGQQNLSTGQTSGKFGDDFPDYSWTASITQPPGPGSSYLRKIEITVLHDYYPKRPYKVILYRPTTLTKQ